MGADLPAHLLLHPGSRGSRDGARPPNQEAAADEQATRLLMLVVHAVAFCVPTSSPLSLYL